MYEIYISNKFIVINSIFVTVVSFGINEIIMYARNTIIFLLYSW